MATPTLEKENKLETKTTPVRIEILSAAENVPLLDKDLHEILTDASGCCEFNSYTDETGEIVVTIECIVDRDEKEHVWDLLPFRHGRNCSISSEPIYY